MFMRVLLTLGWHRQTQLTIYNLLSKPLNITSSSADINWSSNGTETQWEINYNGNSIITSSFPVTLNNLNPNTTYNVTVSAICSASNQSPHHLQQRSQLYVMLKLLHI